MSTQQPSSAIENCVGWSESANSKESTANSLQFTSFIAAYRTRDWLAAIFVSALMLFSPISRAQCNWNVVASPPLPTLISSTYPAGTIIYSGTLTYSTSGCYNVTQGMVPMFVWTWGNVATPVIGMTGLTADNNGIFVDNPAGCFGSATAWQIDSANYYERGYTAVRAGDYCSISVTVGLALRATGATISGTFPSVNSPGKQLVSGSLPSNLGSVCGTGWALERRALASKPWPINCNTFTGTGLNTLVVVTNTCTVSTPSVSVPLPTVAKTALNGAGTTAGLTAFTLGLSGCNTSTGGFTGTQTWAFSPGPASNVIANSGTATNVYAQILDSSLTPITNGGTTTFSIPAGGGAQSKTFYARYYSNGTAGAGTLNSVATFTMTYN